MNDELEGWIILIVAGLVIMLTGYVTGLIHGLDLTQLLPQQFGVDIPIENVRDSFNVYIDEPVNAEYICKKQ